MYLGNILWYILNMGGDDPQCLITYPKKRKIFQKLKTIVFYKSLHL